jgi:excinuclease Cho
MKLHDRRMPEFDALRTYDYPAHLREAIRDLPCAPGVYVFHGAQGDLPLYIGKSVNLRSRVLAHLRNPDEARMLRMTSRISHHRTAGEIGALLLEASLIKRQFPLFNQKLRRNRQLCALSLRDGIPEVVYSSEINFATTPELFGLFPSRHAALEALREVAHQARLCHGALGLEKLKPGRPCFRATLRQCAGVCRGDEDPRSHHERLLASLDLMRVSCWPYPGAIGLVEQYAEDRQIHVVRNWCYLGSVASNAHGIEEATKLSAVASDFDADGYRILCQSIVQGSVEIIQF